MRVPPTARLSLRAKVILGYSICIVLAMLGSTFVYYALNGEDTAAAHAAVLAQVSSGVARLEDDLSTARTAERGYLLTGSPASLDLYTSSGREFNRTLLGLEPLVGPYERDALERVRQILAQWETVTANPEIDARRAAPAGLAPAARAAYGTVLKLRTLASRYASDRSPAESESWTVEAQALRQHLNTMTALDASRTGLAALSQAFALLNSADQSAPPSPAQLASISRGLDGVLAARLNVAQANEARLQQLESAGDDRRLPEQIHTIATALAADTQSRFTAELATAQRAVARARVVAVTAPLVLVFMLALALVLTTRMISAVREVADASLALAGGDFTRSVRAEGVHEFAALASAHNTMAERIRVQTSEATYLREMSTLLQASVSIDDAGDVLASMLPKLVPAPAGALYFVESPGAPLRRLCGWGVFASREAATLVPDACWSLRRSQAHRSGCGGADLKCRHLSGVPGPALCVPLIAPGEVIGVLVLIGAETGERAGGDDMSVAQRAADQIALALANLRLRETLRHQSMHDPLTGLYNRRYLDELLPGELARAEHIGVPVSVLMFDIDHFKKFNDAVGHEAGDVLLRAVGTLLAQHLRPNDVACRYGGDEFVAVLVGPPVEAVRERAQQFAEAARRLSLQHRGAPLGEIRLSAGIAGFPTHGHTMAELLRAADAALYQAKQNGRGRIEIVAAA